MKIILSLIIIFISFNTTAQTITSNDTIFWNSNYKLKWDDFKGIPDTTSDGGAATNSGLDFQYKIENKNKLTYSISTIFLKKESWKKTNINDIALKHEQLHFDITEIFKRKLSDTLQKISNKKELTKKIIFNIFDFVITEMYSFQDKYDFETDYGRNDKKQKEWSNKIQKELFKLKNS